MRLIDKDALMQTLGITDMDCEKCAWVDKEWSRCKRGGDFEDACSAIENALTIDERKRGKWTKISPANIYECSVCGQNVMTADIDAYRFCHGCGADMRESHCDNCRFYDEECVYCPVKQERREE